MGDASHPDHETESLVETRAPEVTDATAETRLPGVTDVTDDETLTGEAQAPELPDRTDRTDRTDRAGAPTIGRYSILRRVGAGAMGVVYAAYDERLDRKVALKLLLRTSASAGARLQQEARGLAQLSHPNVVQVYEIGEHEGDPYIAMEFVEGETLSAQLARNTELTWRERLALVLEAGRGLAAAHQKGMVHRDFKPDNVMIDREGRARVMDFGLVRGQGAPVGDDETSGELARASDEQAITSSLSQDLTQTGAVLGTPAYMAAEQHQGRPADARSDQFSLCVTLWEALYGERPFVGDNLGQLYLAVSSGRPREPARGSEIPGWVRRLVERGLAPDPADRWPSVTALITALERDPTRRRRAVIGVGLGLGLVAAAVAFERGNEAAHRRAVRQTCASEAATIYEIWNPSVAAELEQAFVATKLPFATDAFTRTAEPLDRYTERWAELLERTCLETELDATRSATSRDAIEACLADARAAVAASVEVLASSDELLVPRGPTLALELPGLDSCVEEASLAHRVAPPADAQEALVPLRAKLEHARFVAFAGRYDEALAEAEALIEPAVELGWAPFEAEVRGLVGRQQDSLADYAAAEASERRSFALAGSAGADLAALDAATRLVRVVGYQQARYDEGLIWAEVAAMLLDRLALAGSFHEAVYLNELGSMYARKGDHEQAEAAYEQAAALSETELGANDPRVASMLANLSGMYYERSRFDEAEALMARALAIREQTLGPNHPDVAQSLLGLGNTYDELGRYAEAYEVLTRARAIREAALGPEHPLVAMIDQSLGVIQLHRGDIPGAIATFEQALAITEASLGSEHPRVASLLSNIGAMYGADDADSAKALTYFERALAITPPGTPAHARYLGNKAQMLVQLERYDEALVALTDSLALTEELQGPDHVSTAHSLRRLGLFEIEQGRHADAIAHLDRARTIIADRLGPEHGDVGVVLAYIGRAQHLGGQPQAAITTLEQAVGVLLAADVPADKLADARFRLAQVVRDTGDRSRAHELAELARAGFEEADDDANVEMVDAWLSVSG